ncbi:MAG: UbiX family flavin prenyltransferase [Phycisphaerae bacterium]
MKRIVMGVTGASGAPYARRLARCLVEFDLHLHLIVSPPARRVMIDELGLREFSLEALLGRPADNVTLHPYRDVGASIASGSFLTAGMVICPCSSHSMAAIANGLGGNLITRAAMVTLKEARRLILVPREMPLSQIQIDNMLGLSRAGAIVCPACPGFYMKPKTIEELIDFVVGRVLDLFSLPHTLSTRWEPAADASADETE